MAGPSLVGAPRPQLVTITFADDGSCPADKVITALESSYPPSISIFHPIEQWNFLAESVTENYQAVILSELIRSGVIVNPEDVGAYAYLWKTAPFLSASIPSEKLDYHNSDILFANKLDEQVNEGTLGVIQARDSLFYCYSSESIPRAMEYMQQYFPRSYNRLEDELTVYFKEEFRRIDYYSPEKMPFFFNSIPTRSVLETLTYGDFGERFLAVVREQWDKIGDSFGHIIYGEDLEAYSLMIKSAESCQPSPAKGNTFIAPAMFIDLNTLERTAFPVAVRVIDKNRVLYLVRVNGRMEAGVVNPLDMSGIKTFFRRIYPQQEQYLLYYFPKLELEGRNWRVSLEYSVKDRFTENLLGKDDYEHNLAGAVKNFSMAFSTEDSMLDEGRFVLSTLLNQNDILLLR